MTEPAPDRSGRWLSALVLVQVLLLAAYIVLHSPLVPWLTRELGLRTPDFCYFVCT
jgi:hypothetical protein